MLQRLIELLGEASEKSLFGALLLSSRHRRLDDLRPLLRLCASQPSKDVLRHQSKTLVVATVVALINPAVSGQVVTDLLLESLLMLRRHHSHLQLTGHCRRNQSSPSFLQKILHLCDLLYEGFILFQISGQ